MTTQLELAFRANRGGVTQTDTILRVLLERRGEWVSMPELWRASGAFAVHSRVADIRKRGFTVEQRSRRDQDGTCKSCYRIPA